MKSNYKYTSKIFKIQNKQINKCAPLKKEFTIAKHLGGLVTFTL